MTSFSLLFFCIFYPSKLNSTSVRLFRVTTPLNTFLESLHSLTLRVHINPHPQGQRSFQKTDCTQTWYPSDYTHLPSMSPSEGTVLYLRLLFVLWLPQCPLLIPEGNRNNPEVKNETLSYLQEPHNSSSHCTNLYSKIFYERSTIPFFMDSNPPLLHFLLTFLRPVTRTADAGSTIIISITLQQVKIYIKPPSLIR